MPKIREYGAPELAFQADAQSSPTELMNLGAVSRANQRLGQAVSEVGDVAVRREEQQETSDLNASFAELEADLTFEIDQAVKDGTINTQSFSDTASRRIDELSNNLSTSSGRYAFDRNAARLKGQILKRASRGEAAVAGARAEANVKSEIVSRSSTLHSDPEGLSDSIAAMNSSIEDMVVSGALPATLEGKLKRAAALDLAKGAVRGWANLEPELAQKKLNSGQFDAYLDSDQKAEMQVYINRQREAKLTEQKRAEAAVKRAQKASADAFWEKNIGSIINGSLSTEAIMASPLKAKDKMNLIKAVGRNAEDGGGFTNPRVKNEITKRILLPEGDPNKIVDVGQFIDYVGKGLSMKDLGVLNGFLQKTPEGESMAGGERALFDMARQTIRTKDFSSGGYSMEGEYNVSRFMADYQSEKQRLIKEGKSPYALVDPNSPDYFGFKAKGYKLNAQQTYQLQAEKMKKQAEAAAQMKKQAEDAAQGPKRIKVVTPDGQAGTILESEKDQYLKKGFRLRD